MEVKNYTCFVVRDEAIERNVLGSLMSYAKAYSDISELLSEECFSTEFHKNVYRAIVSLSEKGDPVDTLTVNDELRRCGMNDDLTPYNLVLMTSESSPRYYYNSQVLNDFRSRNRAYSIGHELSMKSKDLTFDIFDIVEKSTKGLSDVFSIPSNEILTMKDAALSLYEDHINKNLSGGSKLTGSPTGFSEFDSRTGGLQAGNLIIVAGETSQGKTSLAMAMAMSAAKSGDPIAFYSMEMITTELFARMVSCETGIAANKYLYGQLSPEELSVFDCSLKKMVEIPVYFDDKSTSNIDVIISSIRVMVAKKQIKGAVIDYLQILNVNMKGANKEQQMGEVARRLKNLAKDLGIWIIALSQLRRDEQNHIPSLNRLRDSGQIAEAADIVILVYRPEVFNLNYPEPFKQASTKGTAMIDVPKGRNIGLMKFLIGFDAATTKFYELTNIPEMPRMEDDNPF